MSPVELESPCLRDNIAVRKVLTGEAQRRKQQKQRSKHLRNSILLDTHDYHDDLSHDVYDDLVQEWAVEAEWSPWETRPSALEPKTDILDSCLDGSSDSGVSDLYLDDSLTDLTLAAFLETLMHLPELFVNAENTTSIENTGHAVHNFAQAEGDIQTICKALDAWMKAKKKDPKLNMSAWARNNKINHKVLQKIMKSFQHHENLDLSKLMETICEHHETTLSYYMGHPDVGYRSLETGELIACCPSSVLRLLGEMPKYVLCLPRHVHASGKMCYFLVTVPDNLASSIINRNFPTFREEEYSEAVSSELAKKISLGFHRRDIFKRLMEKTTLYNDMYSGFHMDVRDNKIIRFFAPESKHSSVEQVIDEVLLKTNSHQFPASKEYRYPIKKPVMTMKVTDGAHCESLCFGRSKSSPLKRLDYKKAVTIVTSVNLQLLIDTSQSTAVLGKGSQLKVHVEKYTNKVLSDLKANHWNIKDMMILPGARQAKLFLHFTDSFTTHRAIQILEQENRVSIRNLSDVKEQMRCFHIKVSHSVLSVVGHRLFPALDRYHNSSKHAILYYVVMSDPDFQTIWVSVNDEGTLRRVIEDVKLITAAKRIQLTGNIIGKKQFLWGSSGFPVLDMVGKVTNTFLQLTGTKTICIYGEPQARKSAQKLLEVCLGGRRHLWRHVGKVKTCKVGIPNDLKMVLNRREIEPLEKFQVTSDFHIGSETGEIWLLPYNLPNIPPYRKPHAEAITHILREVYQKNFEMHIPKDSDALEFEVPKAGLECEVCYTEMQSHTAYITESCAHKYCLDCLNSQLQSTTKDVRFRLACAVCDKPLSFQDLTHIDNVSDEKMKTRILKSILKEFVSSNRELYQFCSKVNCEGIFKKRARAEGGLQCVVCKTKMCCKCLEVKHDGFTCEYYQEIGRWLAEDPSNRKKCPKCRMGIEKNEGCNRVICTLCTKSICWTCLAYFDTSRECYDHMDEEGHWQR